MELQALSSAAFFVGVGSFIIAGLGVMLGLPYIVFAESQVGMGIRDRAVQAIAALLILTLIGAAGVLLGWGHIGNPSSGAEIIEGPYAE